MVDSVTHNMPNDSTKKKARRKLASTLLANAKSAMFAAIEIHNKPIFRYRYEVCTILVVNAWELALKAYIAKKMKSVRLVAKDGTSKPFLDCVGCVGSKIGKPFTAAKSNLEILYEYRNKIAHLYDDSLDIVILGLLKASVLFFSEFLQTNFDCRLNDEANLVLLPIGFSSPISPLDFISTKSASSECSKEVKSFLASIGRTSEDLQKQGIEESIIVNFSIALVNESRIKNADLTAAINNAVPQGNVIAVQNIISAANLTNDASAKLVRLQEESVYGDIFTESYYDVVKKAREIFADFVQNAEFNDVMRELKKDGNLMRVRLLNPKNPKGASQNFYSKRIYDDLAKHYRLIKATKASA